MAGRRPATDGVQPPAQRRRLVEGDFGVPDVILLSEEGAEYSAHSSYLQPACEAFDSMLRSARNGVNPRAPTRIQLRATSSVIELVLPLVYRRSASGLRQQPFEIQVSCLKLAHSLGMPLIVDQLSIYLEAHIPTKAAEIYTLACTLDLTELKQRSLNAFRESFDISRPFALARRIGEDIARDFYSETFSVCTSHWEETVTKYDLINESICRTPDCAASTHLRSQWPKLAAAAILTRYANLMGILGVKQEQGYTFLRHWHDYVLPVGDWYSSTDSHHAECPAYLRIKQTVDELAAQKMLLRRRLRPSLG